MKVRAGFVSNSSSSSFCIYGTEMDLSDLIEKIKETNLLPEEEMEGMEENDEWYELGELLEEKLGLSTYQSEDYFWIGREWSCIDDDETGRQFKEGVQKKLEDAFGPDVDCGTHEEEIYN
jgi:hypothetical protein